MKKIACYALLLTACLAVGSSASATVIAVQSASELTTAFQDAQSGDVIQLQTDIALTSTLWLGTANMTDNSRALTLDLNGHTLSRTANVRMIDVTHGSLIVQSSSAGGRVDDYASVTQQSQLKDMMLVTGSYLKDINPRTDIGYYSHLVIAEGVTINAGQNAITIDRVGNADGHSIQYGTDVYNRGTVNNNIGVAHGARVDIYGTIYANKYGIKPNGLLVAPTTDGETLRTVSSDSQYANYQVEATDTAYAPFIHVHPSALISTHATASEATAVYASGYARWLIEGGCYGNMGLYIRSGCVSVHNAYIESSNPEHSSGTTQYHGVEAEGSAIVLNARSSVGGDISLYMSGATRVVSIAGYAIEEIPTSVEDEGSYIREILLESGTLEAPEYPILVSEETNIEIGDDVNLAITESGSCGDSLSWSYSPTRRTLTITGSGAMDEISTEQQPWADFRTEIQTVSLSEGITTLSANAFSGCTNLYTINIPSTMTHIGDNAFYGCNVLSSVYWDAANYNQTKNSSPFDNAHEHITGFTIGSNVTSIPHHLCFEFTALTSVIIHENIQKIGNSAFEACRALQTLLMYEGLDSIGEYAFKNCTTLTTLTIPQSVGWVGNYAFEGCGLTEIMLNDNEKCLKKNVFQDCNNVTELTIPSTWHTIPEAAFRNMKGLEHVVLPDSVDTISTDAFSYCKRLRSISIPSTVRFIGDNVFYENDSLHTIYWDAANYNQTKNSSPFDNAREHITGFTIGSNVTSIPHHLCYEFTALPSIDIPAAIQTIGNSAFEGCRAMQELTLYEGLDSIGEYAFKNCTTLTTLTIPQSVGWVGNYAFEGCGLTEIMLNDNEKCLKKNVFQDCNNVTELTIPSTWHTIPEAAFRNMKGLEHVVLPDSVDTISTDAFSYCKRLRSISIPSTVRFIGDNVFYENDSLRTIYWDAANYNQTKSLSPFDNVREHVTSFTIGPNVTSLPQFLCFRFTALPAVEIPAAVHKLGTSAFDECTSLSDLTWYEGLDSIGEYAFKNCKSLTELTIPQSVVWIGHNAFESCTSLSSLTLNDNDKVLKENVFTDCNSLTQLTIPSTWRAIPYQAFHYMSGLEQVILPDSLDTIGTDAFSYCRKLRSISIPTTLKHIGDNAFYACDSLRTIYWDAANYNQTKNSSPFDNVREHITGFIIGSNVTSIPHHLCFEFTALPSIEIPASVDKIGNSAFEGCRSLSDLTWYEGLDSIGEFAFKNCTSLTTLTIPQSVDWVGRYAFESCPLTEIMSLATTPPTITDNTFYNVDKSIPVSVPAGTRSRYRAATGWSDFTNYLALPCDAPLTDTVEVTICEGSAYEWRGMTLTETGIYTDSLLTEDGCDSINTLVLTVNPMYFFADEAQTCQGTGYLWRERMLETAGTYYDSLRTVNGCDSVYELTLTVNPAYNMTEEAIICQGEKYEWHGMSLTEAGRFTDTLHTVEGCDSICNLVLTVNPTFEQTAEATICEGTTYSWHGKTYTTAGIYYDSLQTIHGCDSIWTLTLTVNPAFNMTEEATICQGEKYEWHGQSLTEAGRFTDTLHTVEGCDSICNLVLTVNPTFEQAAEATICEGNTYSWHGKTYTTAGIYYDSLQTIHGCDSIWTLTLTVNPTHASYDTAYICYGESYTWNGQLYTAQGDYERTFETQHGCDSVAYLHLIENPIYFYSDSVTLCENMPYEWRGLAITATGTYVDSLQSVFGCDSVYELVATVNPTFTTDITAEICEGETYSWYDQVYNATGDYRTTLTALNGCDSIVTLHLTVNPTALIEENGVICQGGTYAWHRRVLTEAGIYYDTLQTIHGCDSVFRLTLTVYPSFFFEENASTCQGTPYSWHGRDLTTSGIYHDTLQTIHGCDSICTLTLTVNETYAVTEEAAICDGESYTWHGRSFTRRGIYADTLHTVAGCDSICTLILTVNPKYLIEDIVSVREDKLPYRWQGESINQAGDYRKEYSSIYGCDSVHTLHLVVTALPIYTVNVQADHGHVNGTGTYPEGTRITLTAVPDEGFEFQMWSDGSETNPKEFVVMQDTTFRAHFYMPEVEQEVVVDSIETHSVTITWDTVAGAVLYELRIYKNGQLVVTYEVDPDNNIIGEHHIGPDRIVARKDSTGGTSETLQVNIGGLEPGQDYTYSLDALDDDRSYVGAQSGVFTTEEEPIDGLDTLFDKQRHPGARKVLRDGQLYIELPDGTQFDARGQSL